MVNVLASKPGLSSTTTLRIPKDWDPTWFRNFISNQLKGADVRNAVGSNGITVSGNISSPYATISLGTGPTILGGPVTISAPATAMPALVETGAPGASSVEQINLNGALRGIQILPSTSSQVGLEILDPGSNGTGFRAETTNTATMLVVFGAAATRLTLTASGGVLVSAPSSGNSGLQVNGVANSYAELITAPTTSGQSFGLEINAGSTSADGALTITNAAVTLKLLEVYGDGGVAIGPAGTADEGAGTLNVSGGYWTGSTTLMTSTVALANGAGSTSPTLGNTGPAGATTPTKWIAINDNGTVRHIPAW